MENFFSRYKNPLVLMAVLFIQVIALATQVKRTEGGRPAAGGGTRLIRVWTVTAITPFERALVATGHFFRDTWHNYVDLHDVRKQNQELQEELARMRLEQVRLQGDADQSRRLRALLDFKERYIGKTVAAQVIGTSGTVVAGTIQIDKGSRAGVTVGKAVITPDGIVGKVKDVFPLSSSVLLITDRDSGAGVILQTSRLQGILRGSPQGFLQVNDVMSDEKVDIGEQVITSGGDGVYPKGLPVGAVTQVGPDADGGPFLNVRIKPAARLDRLEEVLVVTEIAEAGAATADNAPRRASDVLAQRLPSAQKSADTTGNAATNPGSAPSANSATKPGNTAANPAGNAATNPAGGNRKTAQTPTPTPAAGTKKKLAVEGATGKASGGISTKPTTELKAAPTTTPKSTETKSTEATTGSTTSAPKTNEPKPGTKKKATPSPTPRTGDDAAPGATPEGQPPKAKATPSPAGDAEKPPR